MEALNAALRRTPEIVNIKSAQLATSKSDKNQKSFICGKYVVQYDDDSKVRLFLAKNGSCIKTVTLPGKITVIEPWEDEKIIFCAIESKTCDHFCEVHLLSLTKSLAVIRKMKITSEIVTQISPVFLRPSLSHRAALHPDLLDFHGLAIFATSSGSLLFVDLNIDDSHRLASTFTDLEYLDISVISEVRSDLFKSNTCPAVFEQNHSRSSDAVISTLTVAVQQSLILIGFENGQVSFYALKEMRLIHETPNEDEEYGAIKRIFIQEPGNDPRKVCYMWQCSQLEEQVQLELFALEFRSRHPTKISKDERRMFYSELVSVGHRFSTWHQGHLSSAFAVESFHEQPSDDWEDADIYATPNESYAFFGLQEEKFRLYMFELNGYYNARCPASLGAKTKWDRRYFSILNISAEKPDHIRIQSKFLKHFECSDRGGPLMMTECHVEDPTEPESITFTLDAVIDSFYEENIVHSRQNTALRMFNKIESMESSTEKVHKELEFARLTMNQIKKTSGGYKDTYSQYEAITKLSHDEKVDTILTTALFFGQLGDFSKIFAQSATEVEKANAYKWGKENIKRIKRRFNKLNAKLFVTVCNEQFNRPETWKQLNVIEQLFFDLHRFYLTISNAEDYLTRGCQINKKYANVLGFLVKSSMLPESGADSDFSWNYAKIKEIYDGQRNGRKNALMVDMVMAMVEKVARCELESWNAAMQYPPQSFKSILDLILNIDVRSVITGSLLCYAITDILRTNDLSEKEAPLEDHIFAVFNTLGMDRKLVKYIQGCWYLDNGFFEQAVNTFNSGIAEPIVFTHHWTRICSILLENDQIKEALAIATIHTPEWNTTAELLEITYLRINIYLANKLVFECVRCIQQTRTEDPSLDWETAFMYMVKHARSQGLLKDLFSCQLSQQEQQLVFRDAPTDHSTSLYRKLLSFSSPMPVKPSQNGTPHPRSRKRLQTPTKLYFSPLMRDRRNSSIFGNEDDIANILFSSPSVSQMKSLIEEPVSADQIILAKPQQSALSSQNSEREERIRPLRFKSESSLECSAIDVSMGSASSLSADEKLDSSISTADSQEPEESAPIETHEKDQGVVIIETSDNEEVHEAAQEDSLPILQTSLDKEVEQNNASVYDTPDASMIRPDSVNSNKAEEIPVQEDESSRTSNEASMSLSNENLLSNSKEKVEENGSESEETEVLDQIQKGPSDSDLEDNPSIIANPELVKNPEVEKIVGAELRKDTSMDGDRMAVSDTESMATEDHLLLRRHTVHTSSIRQITIPQVKPEEPVEEDKSQSTELVQNEKVDKKEEKLKDTQEIIVEQKSKNVTEDVHFQNAQEKTIDLSPEKTPEKEVESYEMASPELVKVPEEPFLTSHCKIEMIEKDSENQPPVKRKGRKLSMGNDGVHLESSFDELDATAEIDSEMPALEPVTELPSLEEREQLPLQKIEEKENETSEVDHEVAELTETEKENDPVDEQSGLTKSELLQTLEDLDNAEAGELRKLHKVFFNKFAVVSKTTRGTYVKKIRKHIEERLGMNSPEQKTSRPSSRSSTSSRKGTTTPQPLEKQKKALSTPSKRQPSVPRVDTPLRRSSRIRNKSETSDMSDMSGNESDASVSSVGSTRSNKSTKSTGSRGARRIRKPSAAKTITLKPVPENEEPLFSPPRSLQKSQPKEDDQSDAAPIPFSFSTPSKRGRKRSVDDLEEAPQSPAKAPRKSSSQPQVSELASNESATPLRRSSRSRRGSARSQT